MSTYSSQAKIVCTPKMLPRHLWVSAADIAGRINPINVPPIQRLSLVAPAFALQPEHIAVLTTKFWHNGGVRLTVGFLDSPPADLRARILSHMNAWGTTANVQFVETATDPQVRIARTPGDGYWSYVGTDILSIDADQPTMNLQEFTMAMPESEFHRVVRHETGHTIGCPHEHMRRELVDLIDPDKAIAFFGATQGWSPEMVRRQVLTPIEEGSLWGTAHADPDSIMCYQIPGSITKNGEPIIGGLDIDSLDASFMALVYPKPGSTPPALPSPPKSKKHAAHTPEEAFDSFDASIKSLAAVAPGALAGNPCDVWRNIRGTVDEIINALQAVGTLLPIAKRAADVLQQLANLLNVLCP
ncbi:MAG: M12 family metallopeptidase [Isosphaeraceae bacterium]|nr:M12 family metallopeptidase [Isosphaeraceae bacterium]